MKNIAIVLLLCLSIRAVFGSFASSGSGGGGSGTVTSVAASVPALMSISGSPITSSGTLAMTYSGTALPIANGGTGNTSAQAAIDALLPSQGSANGKFLTSNGSASSWATSGFTPYSARYAGCSTTMVNTNNTILNFSTKIWDDTNGSGSDLVTTGASWKFTVPSDGAGKYLVTGVVGTSSGVFALGEGLEVSIFKNGSFSIICYANYAMPAGTLQSYAPFACHIKLAAGDYISAAVYLTRAAGNLSTYNSQDYANVTITRVTGS